MSHRSLEVSWISETIVTPWSSSSWAVDSSVPFHSTVV